MAGIFPYTGKRKLVGSRLPDMDCIVCGVHLENGPTTSHRPDIVRYGKRGPACSRCRATMAREQNRPDSSK
jgi:hypothetical protein